MGSSKFGVSGLIAASLVLSGGFASQASAATQLLCLKTKKVSGASAYVTRSSKCKRGYLAAVVGDAKGGLKSFVGPQGPQGVPGAQGAPGRNGPTATEVVNTIFPAIVSPTTVSISDGAESEWTVPEGVSIARFKVIGGGGAGYAGTPEAYFRGGGGAGGMAEITLSVTPGARFALKAGKGGKGGAAITREAPPAQDGSESSVYLLDSSTLVVQADGGKGGNYSQSESATTGLGGSASGMSGAKTVRGADSVNALDQTQGGFGGVSPDGFSGGKGGASFASADDASAPGSGGGAAGRGSGKGGNGGAGQVVVSFIKG